MRIPSIFSNPEYSPLDSRFHGNDGYAKAPSQQRLFQEWVPLRLCPDARVGPVAGKDHCVRREGQQLGLDALDQLLPVPPFEVGATNAAPEQGVAGEDQPVTVVRNPPRGMPVSFDYRKGEVSNLDCVAFFQVEVGFRAGYGSRGLWKRSRGAFRACRRHFRGWRRGRWWHPPYRPRHRCGPRGRGW